MNQAGPLSGRTVVVTRSGPRGRALVDALRRSGAETIEIPLTEQADADDGGTALRQAAADAASYRWVVVSSANAVPPLLRAWREAGGPAWPRVAAVGPATADALREAGVEPDLVPAEHRAQGLVDAFPEADRGPNGLRVLFPCAEQAAPTIPAGLAAKGWDVQRVVAYRTVALAPPRPALVTKLADADAVTFAAPSAVEAFVALRQPDGWPPPAPPLVLCIGPSTAARARALGMAGVHTAAQPSAGGIVAALVDHLAGDTPGGS